MRQRRRHHTDERLVQSTTYLLPHSDCSPNALLAVQEKDYFPLEEIFGNRNPVTLEIGCGKGSFSVEYARRHPDKNMIAVERNANIILAAMENAEASKLENLRLLHSPCEVLPRYFPPQSVGEIILNFSTPLPRTPFIRQRLTNPRFLALYDEMLMSGGKIHFKTDSKDFFDYSLEQMKEYGFEIIRAETDLYASDLLADNIATEYEKKFVALGKKINVILAQKGTEGTGFCPPARPPQQA